MNTNILPKSYFGEMSVQEMKAHLIEMRRLYRSGVYSSSYFDLVKRSINFYIK